MNIRTACLAVLTGLPAILYAQETPGVDEESAAPNRSRWSAGVAAVFWDSPYAGEGLRATPFPLVTYEGERFFFRGITGGIHLIDNEGFSLAAMLQARFDGIDAKDLGESELAINGIDRSLLEDRDDGFDAGFSASWKGRAGELDLEVLADITDTSGGQEFSLTYGYEFEAGQMSITPNIGTTWMSDDLANYYYGTLDKEIARGVVDYKPDSGTVPHVGISFARRIGARWGVMANLKYSALPDELADSPLLESDRTMSVFVGFARGF